MATLSCYLRWQLRGFENLRGVVKVVDRKKLEDAACECYRVVRSFQVVNGRSSVDK